MAKWELKQARKDYNCGVCGKTIKKRHIVLVSQRSTERLEENVQGLRKVYRRKLQKRG